MTEPRERPHVDPRYRLANERTFLAWSRTALALVAAGLAAPELLDAGGRGGALAVLVGVPLVAAGGLLAFLSLRRRAAVERAMENGDDLPPTSLPGVLTVVVVAASVAAALLVVLR